MFCREIQIYERRPHMEKVGGCTNPGQGSGIMVKPGLLVHAGATAFSSYIIYIASTFSYAQACFILRLLA